MSGTQFEMWVLDDKGVALRGSTDITQFELPSNATLPTQVNHPQFFWDQGSSYNGVTIRLNTAKPRWFALTLGGKWATPGTARKILTSLFFLIVIFSCAASYALLVFVFRWKSRQAQKVITELSSGNLKARLPVGEKESDQLTKSFNHMAEQIETAFTQLKLSETSRKQLVGELSHDLRTPVTAVRIALDSLKEGLRESPQLSHLNLVEVARKELAYIQRLLEYLFFLAKSGEAFLPIKLESFDLVELVRAEVEARQALGVIDGKKVQWQLKSQIARAVVNADRALTIRLLRNLLDNARKHGHSIVNLEITQDGGETVIALFNDGAPIKTTSYPHRGSAALEAISIEVAARPDTSLGIGSSIIEAIARLHNWELAIEPQSHGTTVILRIP